MNFQDLKVKKALKLNEKEILMNISQYYKVYLILIKNN